MEWILWITYLSGLTSIFGYIVYIPVGFFAYFIWMQYWCWYGLWQMFEEGMDALKFAEGPLRRFALGTLYFIIGAMTLWIPIINLIMSPLLGYLAILDYFDY